MCLFDAVLKLEFPQRRYTLDQYVVYYIWGPEQAALAESIFTYLAHAWVKDGTGFTHHFPGLNNDSALGLTTRQWLDTLAVKQQGPLQKNLEIAEQPKIDMERKMSELRTETAELRTQLAFLKDMENKGLKENITKLWRLQMENKYRTKFLNPRFLNLHKTLMKTIPSYAETYNQRVADREAQVGEMDEGEEGNQVEGDEDEWEGIESDDEAGKAGEEGPAGA
jgi:hypothetical protein